MTNIILIVAFLCFPNAFASTPKELCLAGNYSFCREIFSKYGSQSNREGAVDFFEEACSSQNLRVSCLVLSVAKVDILKKGLEIANPRAEMFTISGTKIDKIYQITELK